MVIPETLAADVLRDGLRQLGWAELVQAIQQRLRFGRATLEEPPLARDFNEMRASLEETKEAQAILARGDFPDVRSAFDALATLDCIDRGEALSPDELQALRRNIEMALAVRDYLFQHVADFPIAAEGWDAELQLPALWEDSSRNAWNVSLAERGLEQDRSAVHAWLRQHSSVLRALIQRLLRFDMKLACAALGRELGANFVDVRQQAGFALFQARNPVLLLRGQTAVPITMLLHPARGIVLSGAHAGGKSTALQTLGLCAAMTRAGMPIPCAQKQGFVSFTSLIAAYGVSHPDRSASSAIEFFSWFRAVHSLSSKDTLCLIDDAQLSTDSALRGHLLGAMLQLLTEKGACVGAATHDAALKAQAAIQSRLVNAAVGFDPSIQQPTFQISLGLPADSEWSYAAHCAGLSGEVLERLEQSSKTVLPKLQRLVRELQRQGDMARRESIALEREQRAIEHARAELVQELAAVEQNRRKRIAPETSLQLSNSRKYPAELDLRGFSVEQARPLLRLFIERMRTGEITEASVVHGEGSGVLRDAVREYLVAQRGLSIEFGPDTDGVTVLRWSSVQVAALAR